MIKISQHAPRLEKSKSIRAVWCTQRPRTWQLGLIWWLPQIGRNVQCRWFVRRKCTATSGAVLTDLIAKIRQMTLFGSLRKFPGLTPTLGWMEPNILWFSKGKKLFTSSCHWGSGLRAHPPHKRGTPAHGITLMWPRLSLLCPSGMWMPLGVRLRAPIHT